MGRDLFNVQSGYETRAYIYKAKYVNNNKLVVNPICEGIIYIKDKIAYSEHNENIGGMARNTNKTLSVETRDFINGITINDYLLINGELWRVNSIPEVDDYELAKPYSRRPRATTTLELRR